MTRLRELLRNLLRRKQVEQELDEELQASLDLLTRERLEGGLSPHEARRQALAELGGVEQVKEHVREMRSGALVESALQDIRYAVRALRRSNGFAAAAVTALSLGITGVTVMFALVEGVLLRPLPVHDQDRLIVAWKELRTSGSARYPFGNTEIESVADASRLLEGAAGVTRNGVSRSVVIDKDVSSYANVGLVTGGFFDVLGVQPMLGRALTPADEKDGSENVIVLSSRYWKRRYGASRDVVERRVIVGDDAFTIVGVMPPDLDYPTGVDIWRTTSSVPTSGPFGDAARREINLIARLRPGVTIEQATSEITALSQQLEAEAPPDTPRGLFPVVRSFTEAVLGDVRTPMLALFVAVGLVLLIASANVANLFLMRGEARRRELTVRAALGAGRARLVRLVLAESVVVAVLAGVVGFSVSWWSLPALITVVPDGLPRPESVRVDAAVVFFSIAVVFLTALLAGIAPALASVRADLISHLRSGERAASSSSRAIHGRRILVVAQVALTVTVVAGAGLLIKSVLRLQSVDLGLPADRLVLLDLHMPQGRYAGRQRHAQFLDEVMAQLEAVPAISAATPVNLSPFSGQGWDLPRFVAEKQRADQAAANPSLNIESVHPNYFETFEVPLVRGRAFTAADRDGALEVAIVSEDVAAMIWPGENALGKRLKMGSPSSQDRWYTIVGVAAQTRYRELATPRPTLYLPAAQFQMTATMLVLRTAEPLERLASVSRDRVGKVDPDVQVMRVAPFSELLDRPLARPRFNAFLSSLFGVAALLLATVGIYAVVAAYVRQRDREIGIRVALGASTRSVCALVLGEGVRLAGVGAAIGLAAALAGNRAIAGLLFGVSPVDPGTMLGATAILVSASALACYVPVRRAIRIDPVAVLRRE